MYDEQGLVCTTCNGYAQGGTLDALCFQLGMKKRLEDAGRRAQQARPQGSEDDAQAIPESYIDDTGIAAPDLGTWIEYYLQVRDGFAIPDNQIICTAITRDQIEQQLANAGIPAEEFPVIVGRQDDPTIPAGSRCICSCLARRT